MGRLVAAAVAHCTGEGTPGPSDRCRLMRTFLCKSIAGFAVLSEQRRAVHEAGRIDEIAAAK